MPSRKHEATIGQILNVTSQLTKEADQSAAEFVAAATQGCRTAAPPLSLPLAPLASLLYLLSL